MKTENKKTLRGSVLFTVVCVMALLIIFLTGTLALASASSNRAHKSYASSQASYTARAAIDAFVQSMERDPGIPAAIEDMGSDPLIVDMEIPDRTLGVLGRYDENHVWHENQIAIEPVPDSEGYIFTDVDGDNKEEWVKVTTVKLTAICRVGKEEETVSAYIKKSGSSHSEVTPGGLDGLQEVGGNAFPNGGLITGGFGLGISKDDTGLFVSHNNTQIETKVSFINGSMSTGTGSFGINIKNPVDPKTNKLMMPNSQTIIMGNLYCKNDTLINIDYVMTQDYTQKDIPYIYIDKTIGGSSSLQFVRTKGKVEKGKAPFNIFLGTLDCYAVKDGVTFGGADLYLLDEYTSDTNKYLVMDAARSYSAEESAEDDPTRDKANDKEVIVGKNFFGRDKGTTMLYDWTSSYVHKSTSQHKTTGGNIFTMGDLTLKQADIAGDVRVNRNCTIQNGVKIHGDLIVKGSLYFTDGADASSVDGTIYCDDVHDIGDTMNRDKLRAGYQEHVNELVVGYYTEVHNALYDNEAVSEEAYTTDHPTQSADYKDDYGNGYHWGIKYPGDDEVTVFKDWNDPKGNADYTIYIMGDKWYEAKPYYATTYDGFVDYDTIVDTPTSIYKVDPSDPGTILNEIIDEEVSYYKINDDGSIGDSVDKSEAVRTYYTDPSGAIVNKADAYENVEMSAYSAYTGSGKEPAYPVTMTREAIYGEFNDSGAFQVNEATKIVKNIYEVRKDLNMRESGDYDLNIYHDHVPKSFCDNSTVDAFDDTPYNDDGTSNPNYKGKDQSYINQLPYAYNTDGSKNTAVWEGNTIVKSCIIGNRKSSPSANGNTADTFELKNTINVKGSGKEGIWIVLRNVHTADEYGEGPNKDGADILCDTVNGKVNFLIEGTLNISKTDIRPVAEGGGVNKYVAGCKVTPQSNWNIEYYGAPGSAIKMFNNCTLVGTFMCPQTTFSSKVACKTECKYVDEYGVERENSHACIVGSALFAKVEEADNEFGVLNSGGSGAAGSSGSAVTALGTYEISYFTGS